MLKAMTFTQNENALKGNRGVDMKLEAKKVAVDENVKEEEAAAEEKEGDEIVEAKELITEKEEKLGDAAKKWVAKIQEKDDEEEAKKQPNNEVQEIESGLKNAAEPLKVGPFSQEEILERDFGDNLGKRMKIETIRDLKAINTVPSIPIEVQHTYMTAEEMSRKLKKGWDVETIQAQHWRYNKQLRVRLKAEYCCWKQCYGRNVKGRREEEDAG